LRRCIGSNRSGAVGQRTDVAARLLARLVGRLRRVRIVVGRRRQRGGVGLEIAQLERQLGRDKESE